MIKCCRNRLTCFKQIKWLILPSINTSFKLIKHIFQKEKKWLRAYLTTIIHPSFKPVKSTIWVITNYVAPSFHSFCWKANWIVAPTTKFLLLLHNTLLLYIQDTSILSEIKSLLLLYFNGVNDNSMSKQESFHQSNLSYKTSSATVFMIEMMIFTCLFFILIPNRQKYFFWQV